MRAFIFVPIVVLVGCVGTGVPPDVLELARSTQPGGAFHIEFAPNGLFLSAGGEVAPEAVPATCRAAADAAFPGGRVTGAERVVAGGENLWLLAKEISGLGIEILVRPDGTVVGGEQVVAEKDWPKAVVDAARAAVPGATLERVEKVWGPEAQDGEAFHVKFRKDGDSLRVGVTEAATVVRVVRRLPGQFRVAR